MEYLKDAPEILEALLAVLGGLRVLARYTPWKWDDKCFEIAEKPVKKAAEFLKAAFSKEK